MKGERFFRFQSNDTYIMYELIRLPNLSSVANQKHVLITTSVGYLTKEMMDRVSPNWNHLEAFPVDDGWAGFVILLLADPHLLEGGERGQDGTTDPDRVFSLWGSDYFDLHCGWR